MATVDRALGVLRLFADERWEWTVEAIAHELALSQSTAYQYVRSLVEFGLLSTYATGRYVIGPAIIELDRQVRRHDPLILAAAEAMDRLAGALEGDAVTVLCRLYRQKVMCVDQRAPTPTRLGVSYQRGRPMPLDRGAMSKAILAHLPPRVLRRVYDQTIAGTTGVTWDDFRRPLRAIRRSGVAVAYGELDPGRVGVSAPIFAGEGEVVGSIGLALSEDDVRADDLPDIEARVAAAGRVVTEALSRSGAPPWR